MNKMRSHGKRVEREREREREAKTDTVTYVDTLHFGDLYYRNDKTT